MMVFDLAARVWALSHSERRVLIVAWLGLAIAPMLVAFLPFRTLLQWAQRGTRRSPDRRDPEPVRIAALVEAAGRHHLMITTCLARSLLLCRLLQRRGHPARLVLGAARANGHLEAHAWVESGGRRLSPGPPDRFVPLLEGPECP